MYFFMIIVEVSQNFFLYVLTSTDYDLLFWWLSFQLEWDEILKQLGFHSYGGWDVEYFFNYLFAICISAFQNCPVCWSTYWLEDLKCGSLICCGCWSPVWTITSRLLSHSVACSARCWLLPLLCRNFLISCHPICQILRSFPVWLESFPEGYCLCPYLGSFQKSNCFP